MAVVSFVFGSVLGFGTAVTGWLFWDATFWTGLQLYFGTSLALAGLMISASLGRCALRQIALPVRA